jgi:hypothetical protein
MLNRSRWWVAIPIAVVSLAARGCVGRRVHTCGSVPQSNGPSRGKVSVGLDGPSTASAGSEIDLTLRLRSRTDDTVTLTGPPELLIASGDRVVGGLGGVSVAIGREYRVQPSTDTLVRTGTIVLGSVREPEDFQRPHREQLRSLPPGTYDVYVVLGDGAGQLVSEPLAVRGTDVN